MDLFSRPRRLLALGTITLIALIHSSPATVAAQGTATLVFPVDIAHSATVGYDGRKQRTDFRRTR